ncbi:MAG TPA: DUF29 domain-containing protein [Acetobacteraceae bacterium]|jgi:Domain of unknown function DUF29|nr:DUF29 domain-containing protein [Acetobacteraceae bacterium]
MSDLYEDDILLWSEQQAELLRRRASGALVNEAELDWPNLAEEIEDVGRGQLHAVESLLMQAMAHLLKAQAWPDARDVETWRADARLFRAQARRRFVPSMRNRIDIAGIYADALNALPAAMYDLAPQALPQDCPFTLEELLGDRR